MKIGFNLLGCGLANNGGSRTLIRCNDTLNEMGHQSVIISDIDRFTWFNHRRPVASIPKDLDAIVATGWSTVWPTIRANIPIRAWYIRGHEVWATDESTLIKLYRTPNMKMIVNSNGLKRRLEEFGVKSHVVHQGIDIDWWEDNNERSEDKIRIGCLYSSRDIKRWCDFVKLSKILGSEQYEYVAYGNEKGSDDFLFEFMLSPNRKNLNRLYNSCHIWFAPTIHEGLHNPPMEAGLCGCLVVCSDHPANGMIYDYCFPNQTAMVYKSGDIEQAAELIRNPNWKLIDNMKNNIRECIGPRERNMGRFIEILSPS